MSSYVLRGGGVTKSQQQWQQIKVPLNSDRRALNSIYALEAERLARHGWRPASDLVN